MNKSVKKIAKKCFAFDKDSYGPYFTPPGNGQSIPALERFVNLIVADCCKIVQERHGSENNPYDCLTVLEIKEHFGIEANQPIPLPIKK